MTGIQNIFRKHKYQFAIGYEYKVREKKSSVSYKPWQFLIVKHKKSRLGMVRA